VNIIDGLAEDIRTTEKLVNGRNDTYDERNMWLAPLLTSLDGKYTTIYLSFERPVIVSAVTLWNYSKTPARGVREFALYCDERIIFKATFA